MHYAHYLNQEPLNLPLGKILCVGRNYAAHARELNNPVPTDPILFIKPATAAVAFQDTIAIPRDQGQCHHELELAVLLGQHLKNATEDEVQNAILGYGLGLDLTLRDLQSRLKEQGQPWEKAKSWDGACPLSGFIHGSAIDDPQSLPLTLWVNDQVRQEGNTGDMTTPILPLIAYMPRYFSLEPGDVVLTGTPAGVAALAPGDRLRAELGDLLQCEATVA